MKKAIKKILIIFEKIKLYSLCLILGTLIMTIVMFVIIAINEGKNEHEIYVLNFSNPSFLRLTIIFAFLALVLSIIFYLRIFTAVKKLDKK